MTERLDTAPAEFSFSASRDRMMKELSGQNRKAVTYDLAFDRASYQDLFNLKSTPDLYKAKKEEVNAYTQMQLKTALSERFNVLSSTVRYEIKDGLIYGENTDEPFIDMLIRGRDYRKMHGSSVDHEREQAEVDGFSLIEAVMADRKTPIGTMMVSMSPRGNEGSVYKHNFYDVYTLKEEEGERYIQMSRYSAGLSREAFSRKAQEIDSSFTPKHVPSDAEFLQRPLKVSPQGQFTTPDDVHAFLHEEHDYMTEKEFGDEILQHCAPLILSYINTLCENPDDLGSQVLIFNAILNKADERSTVLKRKQGGQFIDNPDKTYQFSPQDVQYEINRLGSLPVRVVDTGCGELGGAQVSVQGSPATGPFSVGYFGAEKKAWSYTWGKCVMCESTFTQVGPCSICKTCEKTFDK